MRNQPRRPSPALPSNEHTHEISHGCIPHTPSAHEHTPAHTPAPPSTTELHQPQPVPVPQQPATKCIKCICPGFSRFFSSSKQPEPLLSTSTGCLFGLLLGSLLLGEQAHLRELLLLLPELGSHGLGIRWPRALGRVYDVAEVIHDGIHVVRMVVKIRRSYRDCERIETKGSERRLSDCVFVWCICMCMRGETPRIVPHDRPRSTTELTGAIKEELEGFEPSRTALDIPATPPAPFRSVVPSSVCLRRTGIIAPRQHRGLLGTMALRLLNDGELPRVPTASQRGRGEEH